MSRKSTGNATHSTTNELGKDAEEDTRILGQRKLVSFHPHLHRAYCRQVHKNISLSLLVI